MEGTWVKSLGDDFIELLVQQGMNTFWAVVLHWFAVAVIIAITAFAVDFTVRKIILSIVDRLARKSVNTYDDELINHKVFHKLSHLAPAIVISGLTASAYPDLPKLVSVVHDICSVFIVYMSLVAFSRLLDALHAIYVTFPSSETRPIKGYIQLGKIIAWFIGILSIFSIMFHYDMGRIIAGLGAMAAVLILVFKDTILGLVASIQINGNNMLKPGDWITMPKYNADGHVTEITLNTVKVRNFDKTITTLPTYALVSESFQNWRGVEEVGGRRIKRSINIDMRSVKFLTPDMLSHLKKFYLLHDYLTEKEHEIAAHNASLNLDDNIVFNGRRLTNIGVFRKYLEFYLQNHPKVHKDLTLLVRQLQPTENGLPLEIIAFVNDLSAFEAVQSDIFDHIIAIMSEFGLRFFQRPSGDDIK